FYDDKKDYKRAQKWYRRAVKFRVTRSNAYALGKTFARRSLFRAAKACFRAALRLEKNKDPLTCWQLGLTLLNEGRYAQALKCLNRSLRLDPKNEETKEVRSDLIRAIE